MRIYFFLLLIFNVGGIQAEQGHASSPEKYVIGTLEAGFFSNFFLVLNHIAWCTKNNKIPVVYWDDRSPYFQPEGYHGSSNVWEYYFYPVSRMRYHEGDAVRRVYFAPDESGVDCRDLDTGVMISSKKWAYPIIKKYIKVRSYIKNKVDAFYDTYMRGKKTVGIHLRGTDKCREVKQISIDEIVAQASKFACDQYLIATDEQSLLDKAVKLLPKPVIYYNSLRSQNGAPIHHATRNDKALLGEQVLIEVLLLARCDRFIHTCSNVSIAVHFFNPAIKYVLIEKKV